MSSFKSCDDCICRGCLYYWSFRCDCLCEKQNCGNGFLFPSETCDKYVKYEGQEVKTCLKANVQIFQDGYISCVLIENFGCEKCMEEYENRLKENEIPKQLCFKF